MFDRKIVDKLLQYQNDKNQLTLKYFGIELLISLNYKEKILILK